MLPDQEAALRTPEFQDRYARGVADGLEQYFRSLPAR
jgi:N-acetylmuramoyl-L-alanine amidase